MTYGGGPKTGAFIDGLGEDTIFERLVHAPPHSAYTTLEIAATVGMSNLYVGASTISLPGSRAEYVSLDDLGTLTATTSSFGAGIVSALRNVSGVLVAGGTLTCTSCLIRGNDFGIGGLSVPVATASPSTVTPSITLTHSGGDSNVAAKVVDILTDGSVNVTASGETFLLGEYAFADALTPAVAVATRGTVDFGGGGVSTAGNNFIGAKTTEIFVTRRSETITALDDTWNPSQQRANRNGIYLRKITFAAGAAGKNVTIRHDAIGSTVLVGPAPVPTPSPSTSPSTSPTSTATST
jgi:hypothetical protein